MGSLDLTAYKKIRIRILVGESNTMQNLVSLSNQSNLGFEKRGLINNCSLFRFFPYISSPHLLRFKLFTAKIMNAKNEFYF
jgi:hypothetical protein